MRILLSVIGWVLMIGAAANAVLALVALAFIAMGGFNNFGISVEALMREHIPFLMWTRSAAFSILPPNVAEFFFAAPALVVFPLRAVVAGVLGAWALKAGRPQSVA